MKRVTGIGGIFFQCKNPDLIKDWYAKHLGIQSDQYGSMFVWRDFKDPGNQGTTVWSPFPEKTEYFHPSRKQFMMNYRVQDRENLLELLKQEGVEIVGNIEKFDYGKFAWIMDPEGNKFELREPVDDKLTGTIAAD